MWSGEQAILLENFSILTSLFFCLRIIILSVNRVSLALLLSFIPAIAFAESSDGKGLAVGLGIAAFIQPTDLIIVTLPRNGGISYKLGQEGIPRLMSKNFENFDFILIYPNEGLDNPEMMFTNDFDKSLIEEGINHLSHKARSWKDIFKRKQ